MTKLPGAIAGARIVGERFVHSQRQQNPEGRMPFMDHIRGGLRSICWPGSAAEPVGATVAICRAGAGLGGAAWDDDVFRAGRLPAVVGDRFEGERARE